MKNGSGIYVLNIAELIANDAENILMNKKKHVQFIILKVMYMIDLFIMVK